MSQSGTFATSGGGGGGGSGTPVQQARTKSAAIVSTVDSFDDTTTPTTANTASLLSISFTPTSATNTLIFEASASGANTNGSNFVLCLFAGNSLLTTVTSFSNVAIATSSLYFEAVSGTTSATTYAIRYAEASGLAGTTFINSDAGGVNNYGGSLNAVFTITEVVT